MTQAPAAIFKIPRQSPQQARGTVSRARKATVAKPKATGLAAGRVAGIETRAATRGDGEVIELELGITVYPPRDKGGRVNLRQRPGQGGLPFRARGPGRPRARARGRGPAPPPGTGRKHSNLKKLGPLGWLYGYALLTPGTDDVPPGRAFRAGSGTELQVALLAPDASGQGQTAALQTIAAYCRPRDEAVQAAQRPFRVDVLPPHVSFTEAWQLRPASAGPLWGLVGVGGDTLAAHGPDLASGMPCFIVAGPAKSGRSTILLSMARAFLAAGTPVVLAAPRPSPLRTLTGAPGVLGLFDRPELGETELAAALAAFTGPGVVLIDDAELLRDCGAAGELSRLVALGSDAGRALVLGGDAESIGVGFSGWQVEARRARRGCLTAPSTIPEGDLIGVRLSRDVLGQPPRPGRCLLHTGDGKLITVTVPAA